MERNLENVRTVLDAAKQALSLEPGVEFISMWNSQIVRVCPDYDDLTHDERVDLCDMIHEWERFCGRTRQDLAMSGDLTEV